MLQRLTGRAPDKSRLSWDVVEMLLAPLEDIKPDDLIFPNLKIPKFVDWGGTSETAGREPLFPNPGPGPRSPHCVPQRVRSPHPVDHSVGKF